MMLVLFLKHCFSNMREMIPVLFPECHFGDIKKTMLKEQCMDNNELCI
jgi:hypothetical protein